MSISALTGKVHIYHYRAVKPLFISAASGTKLLESCWFEGAGTVLQTIAGCRAYTGQSCLCHFAIFSINLKPLNLSSPPPRADVMVEGLAGQSLHQQSVRICQMISQHTIKCQNLIASKAFLPCKLKVLAIPLVSFLF